MPMNPRTVFLALTSKHVFKCLLKRGLEFLTDVSSLTNPKLNTSSTKILPIFLYVLVYLIAPPYIQGRNLKIIFNFSLCHTQ